MQRQYTPNPKPVKSRPYRRTQRIPGRFGAGILPAVGFSPFWPTGPDPDDEAWWAEELARYDREVGPPEPTAERCPCTAGTDAPCRCGDDPSVPDAPDAHWVDPRRIERSLSDAFEMPLPEIRGGCDSSAELWAGASLDAILAGREHWCDGPTREDFERARAIERESPPSGGMD